MRFWFISDTHTHHALLRIPADIDAVVHCGTNPKAVTSGLMNLKAARVIFDWYSDLQIPNKIFVPGNHSTAVEKGIVQPHEYPKIHFLIHSQVQIQNVSFFGTPFTPKFFKLVLHEGKRSS